MKYFKEFPDIETYKRFAKSTTLQSPNVSIIANQGNEPLNEPAKFDDDAAFVYVTINVTNISPESQILATNDNDVIDYIEIDDGTILNNLPHDDVFYDGFTITGSHEIKIKFKDKYKVGDPNNVSKRTGVLGVPSIIDVLIPNVFISIEEKCFTNAENLSKINIPPSIKMLKTDAISGSGITSAKIPSTVEYIGYDLFKDCTKLETVDISEANFKNCEDYTLGYSAFYNCTALKSVIIPKSIKTIKNSAFYNCNNLESITFESGSQCELIGYGGIQSCSKLTEITLPEGLITLTSGAIYNCVNIEKIILPSTIKTITSGAIGNCNLKELILPNGLETFNYGAISGPFELDELIIPNSVTNALYCFSGTSSSNKIKKLVLPTNSNTTALSNFFNSGPIISSINGSYLEEIVLPSNLTVLNSSQLNNCLGLTSITLPSTLTRLYQACLGSCTSLTSITIPSSVTEISENAFGGCINLEEVIFENNSQLNILSKNAFYGCSKLSSINIPSTVSDMSQSPLLGCTSLGYVEGGIRYYDLPNNLGVTIISIDDDTLTSYTIKSGIDISELTVINKNNMPNATSITLPEGITSLTTSNSRFADWNSLETINLPNSIETIGDDTFDGCTSLSQISKSSIYSINEYALGYEYYLDNSNKDFSKEYFSMKFTDDVQLTIYLGSMYNIVTSLEYSCNNGLTWTNIKPTSTSNKKYISVDKNKIYMFRGTNTKFGSNYGGQLTNAPFYITNSNIKTYVFGNIMSLLNGDNFENTSFNPNTSEYAFSCLFGGSSNTLNVKSASKLILPNNTAPGCYEYMFYNCTSLKTPPSLNATELTRSCYLSMFESCTSLTTAPNLPATTLANYCYRSMFKNCTSLTTAPNLPTTIITIPTHAYSEMFMDCTSLTKASNNITAELIDERACDRMFMGCTSLTESPKIQSTTLKQYCFSEMFKGCSLLQTITYLVEQGLNNYNYHYNWVNGVAQYGTFIKNSNVTTYTTGLSGVPFLWTVQDYVSNN